MEFQSHIVETSQSMNKKFGAPTPSCFVYKQVNAQPYKTTLPIVLASPLSSSCYSLCPLKTTPLEEFHLQMLSVVSLYY